MVLSNSTLNRNGFRVLTSGIEIEQYKRNPVLLWMHHRPYRGTKDEVLPLGRIENLHFDGDNLIGTPIFDLTDDFTRSVSAKWESGTLNMVSVGLTILELSNDPKDLLPGQRYETLIRCRLDEVSVVDIAANDDAVKLYKDGQEVKLSCGADSPIPPLQLLTNNINMNNIALLLNLPATASEQDILAAIAALQADANKSVSLAQKVTDLQKQLSDVQAAQVVTIVDTAISDGRIAVDKKEHFIALGKSIGADALSTTLESINRPARPSDVINRSGEKGIPKTYSKLSEVPEAEAIRLRKENRPEYIRLYKAEFSVEPVINEE